jgi:hypothetical protein
MPMIFPNGFGLLPQAPRLLLVVPVPELKG